MFLPIRKFTVNGEQFTVNEERGFTLIELLVSVTVIGILIGAAIPSINSFNQRQIIKNSQEEVKSVLRLAQSKVLAGEIDRRFCDTSGPTFAGWYVQFKEGGSSYSIFGRCFQAQEFQIRANFNVRFFALPKDHVFTGLPQGTFGAGSGGNFYVRFEPVSGEAWFYNITYGTTENGPIDCHVFVDISLCLPPQRLTVAPITITNQRTGQTKIINVYSNGQISGL